MPRAFNAVVHAIGIWSARRNAWSNATRSRLNGVCFPSSFLPFSFRYQLLSATYMSGASAVRLLSLSARAKRRATARAPAQRAYARRACVVRRRVMLLPGYARLVENHPTGGNAAMGVGTTTPAQHAARQHAARRA